MVWVNNFLEALDATNTLEDVQSLVTGLRDAMGVEHAIYHVVGDTGDEYGALTYDAEWVEHYIKNKYFLVDPVVNAAFRQSGPIDWRKLDWTGAHARNLMGEAVREGVGKQGITIPVRGPHGQLAMFSVTSYDAEDNWDLFHKENKHQLILAGQVIHQRAAELMGVDGSHVGADLSPRERDVLTQLCVGRTRAEAARRLCISEHTFRAYVDSARQKLGAANTTHAVTTALLNGLIMP